MKHVPRNKSLHQMERALVPERVIERPQLIGGMDLLNANCSGQHARLQNPGSRHGLRERADPFVV